MRLGKGGGAAAALLRNQLTFWSSHPSGRHSPLSRGQAAIFRSNRAQLFQFQGRGDAEYALVAIETAVRHEDVAVGIDWGQISNLSPIAEGLDGDDGASRRKTFRDSQAHRLRLVPAKAGIGKKLPVPVSSTGQAPRKYLRRIFGMPKTKCRWGTFLRTSMQSHSPNSTTRF